MYVKYIMYSVNHGILIILCHYSYIIWLSSVIFYRWHASCIVRASICYIHILICFLHTRAYSHTVFTHNAQCIMIKHNAQLSYNSYISIYMHHTFHLPCIWSHITNTRHDHIPIFLWVAYILILIFYTFITYPCSSYIIFHIIHRISILLFTYT